MVNQEIWTTPQYTETYSIFENRRRGVIKLNQLRGMSAKMAGNEIRTHARTRDVGTGGLGENRPQKILFSLPQKNFFS